MVLYMCKITTDKTYITKLITHFFHRYFPLSFFISNQLDFGRAFAFLIINSYVLNDRKIIKNFKSSLFKG